MNAGVLIDHFDRISNAPDAIPHLRRFILELAVRGKLVEQDPSDEPASELLTRIQAEKARLIKEGILRKEKPLAAVANDEVPFVVPTTWRWARIGACSLLTDYGTSVKSDQVADGVPVLAMGNIQDGRVVLNDRRKVPHGIDDLPHLFLKRFDLLYNRTNSAELVGKTGIYFGDDDAYTFASYLIRIRFLNNLTSPVYANLAMNAPYFRATQIVPELQQQCGQANVNGSKLRNMMIPLPPLAEQRRIVAKVDELMALCDQLQTEQRERETRQDRLAAASHHHLNNGANEKAFRSQARFYLAHLPCLTAKAMHIQQLRQTILNLAVRGRLVAQDPSDIPASELLREIQADKHRLVKPKTKLTSEDCPAISPNEIPYQLPQGWEWARLGLLGDTNIGLTYSPQDLSDHGVPVLRSNNIRDGKLVLSDVVRVDINVKESALVNEGDLLICARNGSRALVGKTAIITGLQETTAFGAFMAIFRSRLNTYIYHFICSPLFRLMIDEVNTNTINQLTQANLRSTLAPIPPLAEQRRIVAKVEALMTMCDRLEVQLTIARKETSRLLESVLHQALDSGDGAPELKRLLIEA